MAGIVTGEDAYFFISSCGGGSTAGPGATHETYGVSEVSINFDRGITEQELVGQTGNEFRYGALGVDGTFTMCKFGASGNADALYSILNSTRCLISGGVQVGVDRELRYHFKSCQITGYDVSFGDASTITEASIDWVVLHPEKVNYLLGEVKDW